MSDKAFEDSLRQFVAEGLSELHGAARASAERRVVMPRPLEVAIPHGQQATIETMWLVTDFVDGDSRDYRLVFDPALTTFGLITPGISGHPALIGLYGDFAETISRTGKSLTGPSNER